MNDPELDGIRARDAAYINSNEDSTEAGNDRCVLLRRLDKAMAQQERCAGKTAAEWRKVWLQVDKQWNEAKAEVTELKRCLDGGFDCAGMRKTLMDALRKLESGTSEGSTIAERYNARAAARAVLVQSTSFSVETPK